MTIEIRNHTLGKDLDAFIQAPHIIFKDDPMWIAPLNFEITERLTPSKNPFFKHGEGTLFTAWKEGKLVGRVSAQIDQEHLKRYNDATGFFGFFDTINDEQVARMLIEAAGAWLRSRGMQRMRGPMSLSINEEVGLLVDGFDMPPMVMMGHSMPYQGALAEACGLTKIKDLLAWRYVVGDMPPRAVKAWEQIQDMPEVKIRSLRKDDLDKELRTVLDIQEDAWADNWGHVSLTEDEARKAVKDLGLVLNEELAMVAEIDGEAAAMCIAFPNLNEATRDLKGKLFPFGFAKLLWRLKVKQPRTARLFLLGIRKKYRHVKRYGGLSTALYVEISRRGKRIGIEWGELSWTLEDNRPVNLGIKAIGGKLYKTYRIYEQAL
jgi:hypothetical protein